MGSLPLSVGLLTHGKRSTTTMSNKCGNVKEIMCAKSSATVLLSPREESRKKAVEKEKCRASLIISIDRSIG